MWIIMYYLKMRTLVTQFQTYLNFSQRYQHLSTFIVAGVEYGFPAGSLP